MVCGFVTSNGPKGSKGSTNTYLMEEVTSAVYESPLRPCIVVYGFTIIRLAGTIHIQMASGP